MERTWFATPYDHAQIEVDADRASIGLTVGGGTVLPASMATAGRKQSS